MVEVKTGEDERSSAEKEIIYALSGYQGKPANEGGSVVRR